MSTTYNRRQALALGLGGLTGLTALGLAGCDTPGANNGSSPTGGGPVTLQMVFWGSTTRDQMTRKAIGIFHQNHPTISITSQFSDFNSYWAKLNTQIAGGSLPDLIQMDMRYISQYARKRLLLDLTQLIYNQTIDLADFDPNLLNSSKANNTVYGVPLGGNYQTYIYDKTSIQKANVGPLPTTMTWDAFTQYATALTKALGGGIYGTADNSGDITNFEVWIRQRGKELYDHDGHLNFDQTDVGDWYNFWSTLRSAGACPPMNIQAGLDITGTPTDSSVIKGKAVFSILYSNQFDAWQKATQVPLGLSIVPTGTNPGQYLKASMLLSASANTKHPTEAANFISFLINDPEAVKAIGIERGVPGSIKARTLLTPNLTPAQQHIMAYMDLVSKSGVTRPKEVLDPPGAGPIADTLRRVSQAIGFGKQSVSDGAKEFFTTAQKALAQS